MVSAEKSFILVVNIKIIKELFKSLCANCCILEKEALERDNVQFKSLILYFICCAQLAFLITYFCISPRPSKTKALQNISFIECLHVQQNAENYEKLLISKAC